MPELPEVESIVRSLDKKISGKKIYRISVLRKTSYNFRKKNFLPFYFNKKSKESFAMENILFLN